MEENIAKHRQMMEFCRSHLTHNILNYCRRGFFFGLVYAFILTSSSLGLLHIIFSTFVPEL